MFRDRSRRCGGDGEGSFSQLRSRRKRNTSSTGTRTAVPSQTSMASILVRGASSGIRLRDGTPNLRPIRARSLAVLPALTELIPRARGLSSISATA